MYAINFNISTIYYLERKLFSVKLVFEDYTYLISMITISNYKFVNFVVISDIYKKV